jgi:hypothetical protein
MSKDERISASFLCLHNKLAGACRRETATSCKDNSGLIDRAAIVYIRYCDLESSAAAFIVMASSLAVVNSSGVRQQVIDELERFQRYHENPANVQRSFMPNVNMTVHYRDAQYIVECMRILLQQERIAQKSILYLLNDGISDEAIDVFVGFLRDTPCQLHTLDWWNLPPQQVRRLLEALHTNRSVKKLVIGNLQSNDAAFWITDLLRHKKDFTEFQFGLCRFPFTQILPLLGGQPNLRSLAFSDLSLFDDPESTQLFVDNVLFSPYTTLKTLYFQNGGVSLKNQPLMAAFHKNTTLLELSSQFYTSFGLFIAPILRRNRNLELVHDMLGTTSASTEQTPPPCSSSSSSSITVPPPCGIWPAVMAKVGQDYKSLGATPVLVILCNRLATWITP